MTAAASNGFPPITRVAIVGMGAIGSVFAAWLGSRLPAGQIRLSALARGQTLTALQTEGLCWTDNGGTIHTCCPACQRQRVHWGRKTW